MNAPTLFDELSAGPATSPPHLTGEGDAAPRRQGALVTSAPSLAVAGPAVRRSDRDTSWAAAESVTPKRTEVLIVAAFARGEHLTADEVCARLPQHHAPTVKSALSRVVDLGVIVAEGEGTSARGRRCTKYRLAVAPGSVAVPPTVAGSGGTAEPDHSALHRSDAEALLGVAESPAVPSSR